MSEPIDALLIGLGAIGTVYSYLLEQSGKVRVTAVARSNYEIFTSTGVRLETERFGTIEGYKPARVFKSQAEALDGTDYAFCVVTAKALPDVLPTTTLLADALASGKVAAYVLIQNGLDVEDDLAAATSVPIVSCIAWIGVHAAGKVVSWRGVDKIGAGIFRADGGMPSVEEQASLDLWVDLVSAGGGNTVVTDNIRSMRYAKNVLTCTQAGIQSLIRALQSCFRPLGEEHHAQLKKFYREVVTVGFKSGLLYEGLIIHPAGTAATNIEDMVDKTFDVFIMNGWGHKWSMLVDIENGRPFEIEVVVGAVVRLARKYSVEVPLVEFAYTLLKGLQGSLIEARRAK